MSLDVYLVIPDCRAEAGPKIFIRRNGETVAITCEEWNAINPGMEPIVIDRETTEVYSANITHNLGKMARVAGVYTPMWHPEEIEIAHAEQLIAPLQDGLSCLRSDPGTFKAYNPENGWGNYEGLVSFVERYLAACKEYPNAEVHTSV